MNATRADRVVLAAFHSSIFAVGLPGNILVIVAYCLSKEFRSRPSNSCLLLLTIGDIFTTLFAPPYYATGLIVENFDKSNPKYYLQICKVAIFALTTTGIVRIFTFTAMSIERYVSIVYPYFYARHITKKKIFITAAIIWVHAMLSTLPAVLVEGWLEYYASNESICKFTSISESIVYTAPMVIFNFTIPTVTVILMNVRVFWIARGKLRRILNENQQFCKQCYEANGDSEISAVRRSSIFNMKPFSKKDSRQSSLPKSPVVLIDKDDEKDSGSTSIRGGVGYLFTKINRTPEISFENDGKAGNEHEKDIEMKEIGKKLQLNSQNKSNFFHKSIKSGLENIEEMGDNDVVKSIANENRQKESLPKTIDKSVKGYQLDAMRSQQGIDDVSLRHLSRTPERDIAASEKQKVTPVSWLRRKSSLLVKSISQGKCRHSNSNRGASEAKILLSTLVLAFAFTLTWAPYVMTRLIITVWKDTNSLRLQMFASASTVINSGLNPIIILLTRKEVRKILQEKLFRRTAS